MCVFAPFLLAIAGCVNLQGALLANVCIMSWQACTGACWCYVGSVLCVMCVGHMAGLRRALYLLTVFDFMLTVAQCTHARLFDCWNNIRGLAWQR